jgi:hypothetical protein
MFSKENVALSAVLGALLVGIACAATVARSSLPDLFVFITIVSSALAYLGWHMRMQVHLSFTTCTPPARWLRSTISVDSLTQTAPADIVHRARVAKGLIPGSHIEIDRLMQAKVELDPIIYSVSGPRFWRTRVAIGIWQNDRVIR